MEIFLCSPYIRYGGAEKQFRMLMSTLDEQNVDYRVLSACNEYEFEGEKRRFGLYYPFPFYFKSKGYSRFFKAIFFYLYALVKFYGGSYTKFYAYSLYCFPAAVLIKLMSFVLPRPVQVIYSERILNEYVKRSRVLSFLYRLMDVVVVNSSELEIFFREEMRVSRVLLINNYVTPINWDCSKKNNTFRLAIPARINIEKNQLFVLDSISKINFMIDNVSLEVHLYGEVDDRAYFAEISKFFDKGIVFYNGVKPIDEIYRSNDLICLPSTYEGTSNVILEAMISKKSFICSRINANTTIPVQQDNVFDFECESLITAIKFFIEESVRVQQLNNCNFEVATNVYSVCAFKSKICDLFSCGVPLE